MSSLGSRVRARLFGWDEIQANNRAAIPDPGLPTYEGMPEWVEGVLAVRHVRAPWGRFKTYFVTREIDGAYFDVDQTTMTPQVENTAAGSND